MSVRILLVDSSPKRGRLTDAIRDSGVPVCDLLVASDGTQALALLDAFSIDVVVANVDATNTDTVHLVAQIALRPDLSRVSVIVLAPNEHEVHAAVLHRMGVRACPIEPSFRALQAHLLDAARVHRPRRSPSL
jgi:response regulator RpfG family c-di-GMP phosphodiesterase